MMVIILYILITAQNMRVKERFKTSKKNNIIVLKYPPLYEMLEDTDNDNNDEKVEKGGFMVVSFKRSSLGQAGAGYFSPIVAFHEA